MTGLNFKEHPEGTRLLFRSQGSSLVAEERVMEWSGTKSFVKLKGLGWLSARDAATLVILEILEPRPDFPHTPPYWA